MPKFSKPKMFKIHNKGSRQAYLPSRKALNQILKGDPVQQSLGNYAKLTPSGAAGMQQPYSDITDLGVQPAIMPAIKDEE